MTDTRRRLFLAASVLPFALSVFVSCGSAPRAVTGAAGDFALLDGGGSVYFLADVPLARPFLLLAGEQSGLKGASLDQADAVLGMMRYAAGGLYGNGGRGFHIAAWGNFPSARARLGLGLSADWRREKSVSGQSYWRSLAGNLSLYLEARRAIISGADPFALSSPVVPPDSLALMAPGAAVAGWVSEPGALFRRVLAGSGIPVQVPAENLLFALYPEAAQPGSTEAWYRVLLRLECPEESQAAALLVLFTMARGRFSPEPDGPAAFIAGFFSNPAERDGRALILRGAPLPASKAALLFRVFSLQ